LHDIGRRPQRIARRLENRAIMSRRLKDLLQKFAASRTATFILYFASFWMVAAASQSGFFAKWGLREASPKVSIVMMLDGTAHRPFVYRQLAPLIANFLDRHTPASWKAGAEQAAWHLSKRSQPEYRFRYLVIYYLTFLSLFISLFLLRLILIGWGLDESIALVTPIAFVLAMPYLQTQGGYFYDSIELLFFLAPASCWPPGEELRRSSP
jgi:predicted permease